MTTPPPLTSPQWFAQNVQCLVPGCHHIRDEEFPPVCPTHWAQLTDNWRYRLELVDRQRRNAKGKNPWSNYWGVVEVAIDYLQQLNKGKHKKL